MKEILDILWRAQERGELRFLVIGGRGLEAHGYQRYTKDLDLMIATDQLTTLEAIVRTAGFECVARNNNFNRYHHRSLVYEPMDVMRVDRGTFDKLWSTGAAFELYGLPMRAPGVAGYVALKLHAVTQNPDRREKDMLDLSRLLKSQSPLPTLDELRNLCEKYGPPGVFDELKRSLKE